MDKNTGLKLLRAIAEACPEAAEQYAIEEVQAAFDEYLSWLLVFRKGKPYIEFSAPTDEGEDWPTARIKLERLLNSEMWGGSATPEHIEAVAKCLEKVARSLRRAE